MARPKTKSALVDGIKELVGSLRNIESKLSLILNSRKSSSSAGRGRPPGSGGKKKPGRPAGKHRGPGRPPGSGNKKKPGRLAGSKKRGRPGRPPGINKPAKRGRPSGKRRGRPAGSKNKK